MEPELLLAGPFFSGHLDLSVGHPLCEVSFPAIRDFEAAQTLALNDDLAVPRAQLDLSNVSAGAVNLFGNQSCALSALAFLASRDVAASVDAKSRWRGVEIMILKG